MEIVQPIKTRLTAIIFQKIRVWSEEASVRHDKLIHRRIHFHQPGPTPVTISSSTYNA